MLAHPTPNQIPNATHNVADADAFIDYARSVHDYTLHLWTESRRIAEEKAQNRVIAVKSVKRQNSQKEEGGAPADA
ncbi:hypothetical protein A0H81_11653 [Grifola frondosa]|uniref:Uncharacterized protein n=1 Tax=Grifola frondosa TaxID=5627 RepID=A0A1C7LUY8_GRIFR|nr:hypothetical protein A0H81_11653 [Grifola frondosa]